MLGRKLNSPWLLAAVLAASPLVVQAAQEDPFAEAAPATAAGQVPAGTDAQAAPATAAGQVPAGTDAQAADPQTAGSEPAPADNATDADADADPFAESGAADGTDGATAGSAGGTSLEDEYGFDPAEEFAGGQDSSERDPWEGFNRAVFRFNDTADRWVLKPVATTYRQVTPIFMQYGVSNFFGNLREVTTTINSVLQWKWDHAGNGAGRFLINSTVGVAGLFDVAQHVGLEQTEGEDFAQTLAVWGVPSGPYLVLPFMGPSTVRGVPGQVVDWYTNPLTYIEHDQTRYAFKLTDLVQTRASLLKTEALLQGDRYVLLRDAYLQRRDYLISDGDVSDDFGSEEDPFGGGGDAGTDADEADPLGGGEADPFGDAGTGDGEPAATGDDAGNDSPDTEDGIDSDSEPDVFSN
ncbi:MlaA family lipoprotein [Microbulbifer yueqingensis]|uniref:ABC-type transporter Mla maintaining outer membrane lipid asymmetry, lipoprotein component MlaA n=1 Tax=Microbulbifer yueqingensis TaxID=658219 RepID=A0A1G8VNS0_9GAMM|nr:VacJ family lipoprotein [Microbulbifer yueqingensis]SDJ67567.1 ABC-type transporter Mla maintaining outer membrane lipid asymmetry, lipoprotein component MlaA [Microbulbifer yueqingensis]